MEHVQKAGGLIINDAGEVVVVTNELGRKTLPKGTPEGSETLAETARREITEETGLTNFTIEQELGVIVRPGYTDDNKTTPSVIKHIHIYLCKTDQTMLKPQSAEIEAAYWVKPDQVSSILSWPEEVQFFEEHRAKLKS